ncbi:adhesive plaque matrix protein [Diachasma alloeum]|uniref:adhesive plaque matrix protein n=1 Tax=Diachasma alloeum TaxID=454923 RepID=UPI0007381DE8|nr:adhesive plaque matrix protein [Diachasma alloeum]
MRFVIISLSLVSLSVAQRSHEAAILSDTRYLSGDGTFGASYKQEDGVEFKEESDANGDRKGSYSYVDPNGVRRTVTYTAGKNGFQASGDGIPKAPPQIPPQPEYEPLPEYNPPDYRPPARAYPQYHSQQPAYQPRPTPPPSFFRQDYEQRYERLYQPEPVFRPRIQFPEYQPEPQYRPTPQYRPEPHYRPALQYKPDPQYRPEPQVKPDSFKYSFSSPQSPSPRPQYNEITTPSPRRFYPPGKLDFTRTPDGFAYSFTKN